MSAFGVPEHFLEEPVEDEAYESSEGYHDESEEEKKDKIKHYIG